MDGGIALDAELLGEGIVLLLQVLVELGLAGIVEEEQHEVFRGEILESGLEQDVLLELLARRAPVGPGEEREDRLFVLLRLRDGVGEAVEPAFRRLARRELDRVFLEVLLGLGFGLRGADAFAHGSGAGTVAFDDLAHLVAGETGHAGFIRGRDGRGDGLRLFFLLVCLGRVVLDCGVDRSRALLDHSHAGLVAFEDLPHGVAVEFAFGRGAALGPVQVERDESALVRVLLREDGERAEECGGNRRCDNRETIHDKSFLINETMLKSVISEN